MNKALKNFVSECKDKLWISSENENIIDITITKELNNVLFLQVLTESCDENNVSRQVKHRNITVHKETAYNYSRSKLLKKIMKNINEESNSTNF